MDIYRTFTKQTDSVVQYLSVARLHEHHTRVEVPKLKHAPVNLGRQLEDYLKDPDFEIHRRQYIVEQDAKKKGIRGPSSKSAKATGLEFPKASSPAPNGGSSKNPFPAPSDSRPQANKGPDPDLIDFFDSIEQNQTPMQVDPHQTAAQASNAMLPQPQQPQQTGMPFPSNGFAPQPTGFAPNDPYQQQQNFLLQQQQQQQQLQHQQQLQQQQQLLQQQQQQPQPQPQQQPQQLQPNFTGAGFGGFTPQPQPQQGFQPGGLGSVPQNSMADYQNQQFAGQQPMQMGQPTGLLPQPTGITNPFRQSMMMTQQTGMQANNTPPFASPGTGSPTTLGRQSTNPFARSSPQGSPSPFQSQPPAAPLQPMPTGTNPFARSSAPQSPVQQQQGIAPQPTGPTNPFRQGAFVNHATGMGWQHNQAPIGGGIDQLQTMPVFPRPAQQTPWQQ